MRTTLTIEDDVYEAAQHLSKVSSQRLGTVVSRSLRKAIREENPFAAATSLPPRPAGWKFPVVDVPAGTPMISLQRIQDAIDDE